MGSSVDKLQTIGAAQTEEVFYQAFLTTQSENRSKYVQTQYQDTSAGNVSIGKQAVNLHQILLLFSVLPKDEGHCSAKDRGMLLIMGHRPDPAKLLIPSLLSK